MNRKELDKFITDFYGASPEFLCMSQPTYAVYRHSRNNKWFAVIMEISGDKIGLNTDKTIEVVNLKCDPLLIGSVLMEEGIHKGYHMNKNYWITVRLDGSVAADKIKWMIDLSCDLTNKSGQKKST